MEYHITPENLIIVHGGHKIAGKGHQRHYPIFRTDDGQEWISLNGQTLEPISNLSYEHTRREVVKRG